METCGGGGERGSMSQSVRPSFGRATDEGRLPCRSKRARAGRGGDEEVSERPLQRSLPRSTPSTLVRAPGEERPPAQRRDEPPLFSASLPPGAAPSASLGGEGGAHPQRVSFRSRRSRLSGRGGTNGRPCREPRRNRALLFPPSPARARTRVLGAYLSLLKAASALSLSAPQACSRSLVSRRPPVRSTIFAGKSQLKSRLKAGLGHSEALKGLPSPLGA